MCPMASRATGGHWAPELPAQRQWASHAFTDRRGTDGWPGRARLARSQSHREPRQPPTKEKVPGASVGPAQEAPVPLPPPLEAERGALLRGPQPRSRPRTPRACPHRGVPPARAPRGHRGLREVRNCSRTQLERRGGSPEQSREAGLNFCRSHGRNRSLGDVRGIERRPWSGVGRGHPKGRAPVGAAHSPRNRCPGAF